MRLPDGWIEHPVMRNGQRAAFVMVKANEIHCIRLDSFRGKWLTRQDIERLTAPIFKQYGHLITKVSSNNATGHQFVQRLGFYKLSDDGTNTYYKAERLKHARL